MADVKVSALAELAEGDLDPLADFLLVSDMSASASKKMKASAMIRASLPYLTTAWDFTTGSLRPTIAETRASSGNRYNSSGVMTLEATDVARFQYDSATLAPRGFLVEGSATNLVTHSENLSDAAWAKTNCTLSVGAIAAPDGAMTADAVIENVTGVTTHGPGRQFTYTSGVTYVLSFFAKADTRTWAYTYMDPSRFGGSGYCYFNLSAGTVGSVSSGLTAFMLPLAGGWYRCVVIGTATGTGVGNTGFGIATGNGTHNYAGDGTSKLYMWGFSLVAETTLSTYVKTTSAAATRAADVATITNPYALTDQCWIIRGRTPRKISGGAANIILQVDDGTINNVRRVYYEAGNYLCVSAVVAGGTTCFFNLGVIANDTDFTVAVRWADNNFAVSLNGGAVVTDPSGANPLGLTTARIGSGVSGGHWNGTIRTIETRRTASDAELLLLAA